MEYLTSISPAVLWFIAAILLILAEFIIPGLVIIFFGAAALVVSLLTWMGIIDSFSTQLLVFTVLSLVLLFGLRWLVKSWFVGDSSTTEASDETSDYIGKEVICLTEFSPENPHGQVEFKGANWKAYSTHSRSKGSRAIIESLDGLCLNLKS